MNIGTEDGPLATFDKFNAVYCSGFFVDQPRMLTALCLIFDQVYFLNPMSFVVDYATHHPSPFATGPEPFDTNSIKVRRDNEWVPLPLPAAQLEAMSNYMLLTKRFWIEHSTLHGKVLYSELFAGQQDLSSQYGSIDPNALRDPQKLGAINFHVQTSYAGTESLIARMLERGAVPVFTGSGIVDQNATPLSTTRGLASLLALQVARMALPATRAARSEVILEARERLSDHLPAFRAYMLRLSSDFRAHILEGMPLQQAERECQNFIDERITPVLLETRRKMTRDYKTWFHKIIMPVTDGLDVAAGSPNLSWAGLLAILAKSIGGIMANSIGDNTRHIDPGLVFVVKLQDIGVRQDGS